MKGVLIAADAALGSTTVDALTNGQLGLVVTTKTGVTKMWASGDTVEKVQIALGRTGTTALITPAMDVPGHDVKLRKATATAAAANKIKVSFSGGGAMGVSPYDEFEIRIDQMGGIRPIEEGQQGRTYSVQGIFANQTALYTALAKVINESELKDMIAAVAGDNSGVEITSIYTDATLIGGANYIWDANSGVTNPLHAGTVTTVTALVLGSGQAANIQREFNEARPHTGGGFYVRDTEYPYLQTPALTGAFIEFFISVRNGNHTTDLQAHGNEVHLETIVTFPSTSTTNANNFQAAIEEIFGKTFVTTAAS